MRSLLANPQRNIAIFITIGILLVWLAFEKIRFEIKELQIKFAREQIELFREMVAKAEELRDVVEVRKAIRSIESYYPSGTKQSTDSNLDQIVEGARHDACIRLDLYIRQLIAEPNVQK
jgi:hypothetical protein